MHFLTLKQNSNFETSIPTSCFFFSGGNSAITIAIILPSLKPNIECEKRPVGKGNTSTTHPFLGSISRRVRPPKLTWTPKIPMVWKKFLFQTIILRLHISFRGVDLSDSARPGAIWPQAVAAKPFLGALAGWETSDTGLAGEPRVASGCIKVLLMEEILHRLYNRQVVCPLVYKVSYSPGGTGFPPSTVLPSLKPT